MFEFGKYSIVRFTHSAGKKKAPSGMDLSIILEKPSLLSSVVDVSSFLAQFPTTLYRFFQVHKKEDELISFVIDLELASGEKRLHV
jgi:hypothetical protein